MVWSMLFSAKLPKGFWGKALKTVCYLVNRSHSHILESDVPQMVWSGKKVNYFHLKVFGCKAFVHVPREQRVKLDAGAVECIFLGYDNEQFCYILWDLKN